MKLPEIWLPFSEGKWVTRDAWRKNFAVRLCNLKAEPCHPILMEDTQGFLFHFGGTQTRRIMKRGAKDLMHHGLQHDLLADDWKIADQTACDMALAEAEKR